MEFVEVIDKEMLEQADRLLYDVLWKPYGIADLRGKFRKGDMDKVFAAVDDGRLAGVFVMVMFPDYAEIRHAAVLPEYQKKGIGRGLWHKVLTFLKSTGVRKAEVYARNSAVDFWAGLGFYGDSAWLDHELFVEHGIRFRKLYHDCR